MKKILSVVLALILLLSCMTLLSSCGLTEIFERSDKEDESGFKDGDGTEENPYIISSTKQLKNFAKKIGESEYADKHYKLTKDIDLNGAEWTPVSGDFLGVFDGNGHTVSNFKITKVDKSAYSTGFFNSISGTVKSFTLSEFYVELNDSDSIRFGGLVGSLGGEGAIISDCAVYGGNINVVSDVYANVGGIIGEGGYLSSISNCEADVTMSVESTLVDENQIEVAVSAGGLAGRLTQCTVTNCSASSTVNVKSDNHGARAGVLVGYTYLSELTDCVADGTVEVYHDGFMNNPNLHFSSGHIGGLAGEGSATNIKQCSFNGNLRGSGMGNYFIGGLVGNFDGKMINSYARGTIELDADGKYTQYNASGAYVGGLVGIADVAEIENSYSANNITVRYTEARLAVGGIAGGVISNINCSLNVKNCVTISDINANLTVTDKIFNNIVDVLSLDSIIGSYFYGTHSGCYRYAGQSISSSTNFDQINTERDQFADVADTSLLNSEYFYTDTLGWDAKIWNFENLNIHGGGYPEQYASEAMAK